MRGTQWAGFSALVAVLAAAPGGGPDHAEAAVVDRQDNDAAAPDSGRFRLLSYNVAGLPQWISKRQPREDSPRIGEHLGRYDFVLLQEDFAHHEALTGPADHPFRSGHLAPEGLFLGDGLSRLSRFAFEHIERDTWKVCNGTFGGLFDCWATKGLSFARHELASSAHIDVYNVHFDAGRGKGDRRAKRAQVRQLIDAVQRRSAGEAVVVAGDAHFRSLPALSARLRRELGLRDVCAGAQGAEDRSDRLLLRSGDGLALDVIACDVGAERFVDESGEPLSDHDPVGVELRWRRYSK